MKRILSIFVALMICAAMLAGCGANNNADTTSGTENSANGAAFNLADFSNPFLGEWQSEIPSANTTLTFNYKADGTFDYEMAGVSADQGGKGTGCYIVYGDKQVSYFDYEGAASYSFSVVDQDTIDVTELEQSEQGEVVPGNTAQFIRVK